MPAMMVSGEPDEGGAGGEALGQGVFAAHRRTAKGFAEVGQGFDTLAAADFLHRAVHRFRRSAC